MRSKDLLYEYYDPEDDELFRKELSDTRRPKLTFKHLQKLRKIREVEKYEDLKHKKFVRVMYQTAAPEEGGGGMM